MDSISIKVCAKINLFLDITGVRDDGYHLLDMRNASVDIFDTLIARKSKSNQVIMDGRQVGRENTAVKALQILSDNFNIHMQVDIRKGIPFSAGLGGSSADASGVFFCAHKLYGIKFDILEKLAVKVGCDVPYMMSGGGARVQGVGDIVTPQNSPRLILVICQSAVGASTGEIYAKYDDMLNKDTIDGKTCVKCENSYGKGAVESNISGNMAKDEFYNALEKPAIALAPNIRLAKEQLLQFTDRVFMTGSGSAYVGIFQDISAAQNCVNNLSNCIFKTVATTIDSGIQVI